MSKSITSLLLIFTLFALSVITSNIVYADVIPPKQQMDLNFSAKEVVCKENLVKVIRTANGNAVCVTVDAIELLTEREIIQPQDTEIISDALKQKPKMVGKITHMATTKSPVNPGDAEGFAKVTINNYVFKVCAENETIKRPEIIISSDSETKSVKLPRDIREESCYTTAVKVRATDPNTITSRLLNQGGVTEIITELENKIEELKLDLTEQRGKISGINQESPDSDRAKKVSAIHKKITDIRNELKTVRSEMQKYMLFLSLSSSSDISSISKGKSITGIEVDDAFADVISVHHALIQPENPIDESVAYNVIFETCTNDNILRIPIVELTSDVETKTVKMAEKIPTNSCQVTIAKINAKDVNSISVQLAGQTVTSLIIIDLEKRIVEVKDIMKTEQEKLNSVFTSSTISKEERQSSINESTTKLVELRKEINNAKIELHKILLQIYR